MSDPVAITEGTAAVVADLERRKPRNADQLFTLGLQQIDGQFIATYIPNFNAG